MITPPDINLTIVRQEDDIVVTEPVSVDLVIID